MQKQALKEMIYIILTATLIGLGVNFLHPKNVNFIHQRPDDDAVENSVLNQHLHTPAMADSALQIPVIVNTGQVHNLIKSQRAILIDARSEQEFQSGHIPGAINIPFENLYQHMDGIDQLPQNKWLISYCGGPPCDLGELLGMELVNFGFPRIAIYHQGLDAWAEHGYEIEKTEDQ